MQGSLPLKALPVLGLAATALLPGVVSAEPYAGFSLGRSAIEVENVFDENDSATKLIVGYIFDLPAVDLSFEASYIDFGSPRDGANDIEVGIDGIDALAVVGVDFGLVGVFGKGGIIAWDADISSGPVSVSDDGTDSVYGVGVRFNVRSLAIRAEWERFNIEATNDLDLFSAGIIWRF